MNGDYQLSYYEINRKDNYETGYDEGYNNPTGDPLNKDQDYCRGYLDGAQDRIWELQHPFQSEAIDNFPD